jgi:malonyl-CoA O-methyltransferase
MKQLLAPRDGYELWADSYPARAHNPLMRAEQEIVEPLLLQLKAVRSLDVGTGSGRYLPVLRAAGARLVIGVDFSLPMLARGSGRRVCADACRLPLKRGIFDVVNASLMIGDVEDLDGWTREMARALAVGGHLVYSDFHPSWARHGWSRTFRTAGGELHDIAFHARTIEEHLAAIEGAGLRVRTIREPRFRDDRDPEVRAFRKRWGNPQVVVVFHAVKEP